MESTAAEVAKLKEVQQAAMAEQMQLDEASLQRLHAEQAAAKVALLLHAVQEAQRTQLQDPPVVRLHADMHGEDMSAFYTALSALCPHERQLRAWNEIPHSSLLRG